MKRLVVVLMLMLVALSTVCCGGRDYSDDLEGYLDDLQVDMVLLQAIDSELSMVMNGSGDPGVRKERLSTAVGRMEEMPDEWNGAILPAALPNEIQSLHEDWVMDLKCMVLHAQWMEKWYGKMTGFVESGYADWSESYLDSQTLYSEIWALVPSTSTSDSSPTTAPDSTSPQVLPDTTTSTLPPRSADAEAAAYLLGDALEMLRQISDSDVADDPALLASELALNPGIQFVQGLDETVAMHPDPSALAADGVVNYFFVSSLSHGVGTISDSGTVLGAVVRDGKTTFYVDGIAYNYWYQR